MDSLDERILEYFGQLGQGFEDILPAENPAGLHLHIAVREGSFQKVDTTFSRRLRKLKKREYLTTVDENDNYYYLTEKGQRFLAGELQPEEIENSPPKVK